MLQKGFVYSFPATCPGVAAPADISAGAFNCRFLGPQYRVGSPLLALEAHRHLGGDVARSTNQAPI